MTERVHMELEYFPLNTDTSIQDERNQIRYDLTVRTPGDFRYMRPIRLEPEGRRRGLWLSTPSIDQLPLIQLRGAPFFVEEIVAPIFSRRDLALQFFNRRLEEIPTVEGFYYSIREVENRPPGYVIDLLIVIPESNRELEYRIYGALESTLICCSTSVLSEGKGDP